MKSNAHNQAVRNSTNAYQLFNQEVGDIFHIIADALGQLGAIQTETLASLFATEMVGSVPLFSPGNGGYLIEKIPELYRNQSEQVLKAVLDSTAVISGAQIKLLQSHADHISNSILNDRHEGRS